MGKVLNIRVWAQTYRIEDVAKTWPRLNALVWPEEARTEREFKERGVLELVRGLEDGVRFEDWPEDKKAPIRERIDNIVAIRDRLDHALGEWQPAKANTASDELEAALGELEAVVPKD